jgi:hypothetical protein
MRGLRVLLVLMLIGGGVGLSLVFVSKAARSLRSSPLFQVSPSTTTTAGRPGTKPSGGTARRRPRHASGRRATRRPAASKRPAASPAHAARQRDSGGALFHIGGLRAVVVAGLEIAAGVLLLALLLVALVLRRMRRRGRREYGLYELHLSTHDQAKGQDLEDMVESIANIVRAWPADRVCHG